MCVVGSGNIDNVHLLIRKYIVNLIINFINSIFFSKSNCLFVRTVCYGIQFPSVCSKRLCQLIGDHATSESSPFIFFHNGVLSYSFYKILLCIYYSEEKRGVQVGSIVLAVTGTVQIITLFLFTVTLPFRNTGKIQKTFAEIR